MPSVWSRGLAYYTTIKDVKKSELPKVNVTVCVSQMVNLFGLYIIEYCLFIGMGEISQETEGCDIY